MDKKNNNKLGPAEIVILIIAAFGLIIFISDIAEAIDETKRERAEQDRWYYENIQKGADEYNRNHPAGSTSYNPNASGKNNNSYSTTGSKSSGSTVSSSTSSKSKTSTTKKNTTSTKTVDPMEHDIDTYYEDYKDEFEDEDDAWDDFEDNDEYWDDY